MAKEPVVSPPTAQRRGDNERCGDEDAVTGWLLFGNQGVIADNDPAEQENAIKFNQLLANCAIFHTTVDMLTVIRGQAEGRIVTIEISPWSARTSPRTSSASATTPPTSSRSHPTRSTRVWSFEGENVPTTVHRA